MDPRAELPTLYLSPAPLAEKARAVQEAAGVQRPGADLPEASRSAVRTPGVLRGPLAWRPRESYQPCLDCDGNGLR